MDAAAQARRPRGAGVAPAVAGRTDGSTDQGAHAFSFELHAGPGTASAALAAAARRRPPPLLLERFEGMERRAPEDWPTLFEPIPSGRSRPRGPEHRAAARVARRPDRRAALVARARVGRSPAGARRRPHALGAPWPDRDGVHRLEHPRVVARRWPAGSPGCDSTSAARGCSHRLRRRRRARPSGSTPSTASFPLAGARSRSRPRSSRGSRSGCRNRDARLARRALAGSTRAGRARAPARARCSRPAASSAATRPWPARSRGGRAARARLAERHAPYVARRAGTERPAERLGAAGRAGPAPAGLDDEARASVAARAGLPGRRAAARCASATRRTARWR